METGSWIVMGAFALLTGLLLLKVRLLHRAAKEMEEAFLDRLRTDSNVLLDTSSCDPYMRGLARAFEGCVWNAIVISREIWS